MKMDIRLYGKMVMAKEMKITLQIRVIIKVFLRLMKEMIQVSNIKIVSLVIKTKVD